MKKVEGVDALGEAEGGVAVFVGLEQVKQRPRSDGDGEAANEIRRSFSSSA